jgi:hypothetical protein
MFDGPRSGGVGIRKEMAIRREREGWRTMAKPPAHRERVDAYRD